MSFNPFANKADLEAAQSQIESLSNDLTAAQSELTAERGIVAAHAQTIVDLQSQVSTLTAEREQFETQATQAQSRIVELETAVTTANESAAVKASELLAASGHVAPVEATDAIITNTDSKKKTREEFNAMTPREKSDFSKKGGRITE